MDAKAAEIQYRINAFHESTGSIMVTFLDGALPEGITFALNLPVSAGSYPRGDALDRFIRQHIPHEAFRRARESAGGPECGHIAASIVPDAGTAAGGGNFIGVPADEAPYCFRDGQLIMQPRPLARTNALDTPSEIL